jgi:molybdopterin-guanine dinucleotide biosynthesis protein A
MGRDKAWLPFGPETMLERVVRLLGQVVAEIIVVAASEQTLPKLSDSVRVVRDRRPGRGPLEGLAAGLAALGSHLDAAYVTSCDVPLLCPQVVTLLAEHLAGYQVVVPQDESYAHPLAAVYRPQVVEVVERLLAEDRLRPAYLFDQVATLRLPVERLRGVDPELQTLMNLNTPEDYQRALERAGL